MPYIYKITNKINNKIYIGKTLLTVEKRWKEHLQDYQKDRCEKRPLYNAMNKYGIDNFAVETLEEVDATILSERETYWIEYYGSFKNGYNATKGGDGKPYLDYDLIYSTYKTTLSVKETARLCHCCEDSVSNILTVYGVSSEERLNNAKNLQKKRFGKSVAQIDKETNKVIAVYSTIAEAEKDVPKAKKHISAVCNGKRKTAGGYKWQYI